MPCLGACVDDEHLYRFAQARAISPAGNKYSERLKNRKPGSTAPERPEPSKF
jgi:hypothetical protein